MELQHVSSEDRSKAIAIVAVFALLTVASLYYSRLQGWVLIVEITAVIFVLVVWALVYDYFVIR